MAAWASTPLTCTVSLLPGPAASIIRPMMLLPLTFSPSFSTKMSQPKRLAILTNMAAGRAWVPGLLAMGGFLGRKLAGFAFFGLILWFTGKLIGADNFRQHNLW